MKSALLSTSLSDAQWTEHLPSVCEIIAELLNNLNSSLSFEQAVLAFCLPRQSCHKEPGAEDFPRPITNMAPSYFHRKIEKK